MTTPTPPIAKPSGSFLTRKYGPLPVWAYMLLAVAAAVVYSMYQKNKAASSSASSASPTPDQTPPQVFQTYVNVNDTDQYATPPPQPPIAGRPRGMPPAIVPVAPPPAPNGPTPAVPQPFPVPGRPAPNPAGDWVTVAKYTSTNPPWNSTLWGIAANKLGNGNQWGRIWNAPQNAALKSRRKDPKAIQPGDKIFVPR